MKHNNYRMGRPEHLIIASLGFFFLLNFNQLQAQDLAQDIMGKWILESTGDAFTGGSIDFLEGGTHIFKEEFPDGTKAELKGGYLLDKETEPSRLRLCLGDCNAAGSEWTSNFCIVQLAADGKLEIYMSQTGEYPDKFPEDKDAQGMYVFVRE
jgi:hypothetical protein